MTTKAPLARIENNSFAAALCYVVILLAGPALWVKTHSGAWAAMAVLLPAAAGALASRGTRLRYNAAQAALLYSFAAAALGCSWAIFLGRNGGAPESNPIAGFMAGMVLLACGAAVVLAFVIACLYAAVRAGAGRDARLPVSGKLATWLAEKEFTLRYEWPYALAAAAAVVILGYYAVVPAPPPPAPDAAAAAQVTVTEDFAGFPWGIDIAATRKLAAEKGWKTGESASSMYGLPCRGEFAGYPAVLQFFYSRGYGTQLPHEAFYKGFVVIKAEDAPLEELYRLFHAELSGKYGAAPDTGYPPWRMAGSKPYGPGYGAQWEITNGNRQTVRIQLAMEMRQAGKGLEPSAPTSLAVRYENFAVSEQVRQASERYIEEQRRQQEAAPGSE